MHEAHGSHAIRGGGKGEVPSEWVSTQQVSVQGGVGVRDWRKAIQFEAVRPAAAMAMTRVLLFRTCRRTLSSRTPLSRSFPSSVLIRPARTHTYGGGAGPESCWCQAGTRVGEGWRGLPKPRRECDVKMRYGGWPAGIS